MYSHLKTQQRFIMAEGQNILRALCHKITVYTDGRLIVEGPIELKVTDREKQTAARTTWEKKQADYITFAFDFTLTSQSGNCLLTTQSEAPDKYGPN